MRLTAASLLIVDGLNPKRPGCCLAEHEDWKRLRLMAARLLIVHRSESERDTAGARRREGRKVEGRMFYYYDSDFAAVW